MHGQPVRTPELGIWNQLRAGEAEALIWVSLLHIGLGRNLPKL